MGEREIIIADTDAKFRRRMADFFKEEGFKVGTAASADEVLARVMENRVAVLLLGSNFGDRISTSELIHLLKKCNRHLHIIMVSEELSLSQARQVRQEGIFYHALKPSSSADTGELWQAVACAFEKHRVSVLADPHSSQRNQAGPGAGRSLPVKLMSCLLLATLMGASYYFLAAPSVASSGNWTTLLFLGFCALIIVGQLLPIFRIKLPARLFAGRKASQSSPRGGK
ncbi:hypothetical protein GMLC_20150 [Geomonas limicola]|uniref:Response regulatory domain-containing protein n=1 Tax=Geomonas limicola TaxID=2740186 RepID=A0A6V8N778_9BACT|nr:response regulator [Geomonas limicola]GFO68436.1 hypothetical protein GMLC_20150 [Geomonas limicola]